MECHPYSCAQEMATYLRLLESRPDVWAELFLQGKSIVKGLLLESLVVYQDDNSSPQQLGLFRCRISGDMYLRKPETNVHVKTNAQAVFKEIQSFCQKLVSSSATSIQWYLRIDWQKSKEEKEEFEKQYPPGTVQYQIRLSTKNNPRLLDLASFFTQCPYTGGITFKSPMQLVQNRTLKCST